MLIDPAVRRPAPPRSDRAPLSCSRTTRGRGTDPGTSAVELVITMPALLLAVMSIIQFGLWQHAQHVALAAAQEGARVARAYDGGGSAASQRTNAYLQKLGPTILSDRSVSVHRTTAEASVTVTGTAVSVFPVFGLRVEERAGGPVERFVPDTRGLAP
jgi:Flp pilus assembly protein TadG